MKIDKRMPIYFVSMNDYDCILSRESYQIIRLWGIGLKWWYDLWGFTSIIIVCLIISKTGQSMWECSWM